jgi:hypothetical protein
MTGAGQVIMLEKSLAVTRRRRDPLRSLTDEEREVLE